MSDIKIEPFLESSTVEMYRLMEDFQEVARVRGLKRARQYAAAPDMHEALQCSEDYKKYANCRDEDEQSTIEHKWLSKYEHMLPESQRHRLPHWQFACLVGVMRQAALKKAEGESE